MKIIHTADWHLGDNFHGYDRTAEHEHFLHWLEGVIADERPDALLLAGDVFDNANPSAQAEEMFYRFLAKATALHPGMRIIITAGNHDSGRRLQAPSEALRSLGVEIRGVVEHDEKNQPLADNLIIPVGAVGSREVQAVVIALPYLRTGDIEFRDNLSRSVREFVQKLAAEKGITAAQLSLAWLLAQKPFIVPIPGTSRMERMGENTSAAAVTFTANELSQIRTLLEAIPGAVCR